MRKPHFHFITLFPDTISVWLNNSIIGRAYKNQIFDFSLYQLRDFSENKHKTVDDTAYGGGGGMVLKIEPLVKVTEMIFQKQGGGNCHVIYFSPAGRVMNQELISTYALNESLKHFILICGHYEGIDQRYIDHWVDTEISLGDFVVSGGEIPALAFSDSLIRQLEGTLHHDGAAKNESFSLNEASSKLLEYPHFTRPAEFRGYRVPEVLLGGDHKEIRSWRLNAAKERTREKRRDLIPPFD